MEFFDKMLPIPRHFVLRNKEIPSKTEKYPAEAGYLCVLSVVAKG